MIKPRAQMDQLCLYDIICEIQATHGRLEFWGGIELTIKTLNTLSGKLWTDDNLEEAETLKQAARDLMKWYRTISGDNEHEKANLGTLWIVLNDKLGEVGGYDE